MRINKLLTAILITFVIVLYTSCSSGSLPEPSASEDVATSSPVETQSPDESVSAATEADTEVALCPAALDMAVGRSIQLAVEISGDQAAEWTSSDSSVASVNPDGTVRALAAGETMITVSAGGSSDVCRVTATESGATLAYQEDPGPLSEDGQHESSDDQGDNYPVAIPDDQDSIDNAIFDDAEYCWQFNIDDEFDTQLKVPNTSIVYTVHYHVVLDAHRVGGSTVTGDYEGTMTMEGAIDEASFISAMQSMGVPATSVNLDFQVQPVTVQFSVVPYQIDEINEAKFAYTPGGTISIPSLVQAQAMAISSAQTSTSGSMQLQVEEGYGSSSLSDQQGNIPYVIEVSPDGAAVLYLPRMLSMCDRNSFRGVLTRLRIVDLP